MADTNNKVQYTELVVGENHPSLTDVTNRYTSAFHDLVGRHLFKGGTTVASASTISIPDDENYILISGTTDITDINAKSAGCVIVAKFTGTGLRLIHSATNFELPDGKDVQINTDDIATFHEYSAGNWRLISLNTAVSNDTQLRRRNLIINGAMDVWERGGTFVGITSTSYAADRFQVNFSGAMVGDVTRSTSRPTLSTSTRRFNYSYLYTVTTADASIAATDFFQINYKVEGYDFAKLAEKYCTLSFWVRSSKTGIHCISFQNDAANRSYVVEYTINVANTWELKTTTIFLDSTGTWSYIATTGLNIGWTLACGSNYQTTKDAWQAGNFYGTSSQVNVTDTIGNTFAITGVQLESGVNASPFENRSLAVEKLLCDRYYESGLGYVFSGDVTSGETYYTSLIYNTEKRAAGTVTLTNVNNAGFPTTAPTVALTTLRGFRTSKIANSTVNGGYYVFNWAADAEL